jgi:hypothetical protein
MSVASNTKQGIEVTLLRPDHDSQTFTLPERATLADLLREAGGGIELKNILLDGRPLEEVVILNSGMAITVVPERPPDPRKGLSRDDVIGDFNLFDEVATFEAHLPGWADREGQFVLIKGRDVLGFYPSREEALDAGYDQLGIVPLLVKQILADEPIYQIRGIEL